MNAAMTKNGLSVVAWRVGRTTMPKTLMISLSFGMLLSVAAQAETLDTRLKLCLDGNLSDVEKDTLILELTGLKITFSPFVEMNAAACFTNLTGVDAVYSKGSGLVIDAAAVEVIKTANSITEAELNERANSAEKLRQEAKCDALAKRNEAESLLATHEETIESYVETIDKKRVEARRTTVVECNYWAEEDLRGAVTNPICQKVFEEFGLPNSEIVGPSADSVLVAVAGSSLLEKAITGLNDALNAISEEEVFVQKYSELELQKRKIAASEQSLELSAQADLLPAPKTFKPIDDGC
jgi:hypothetical protein